MNTIDTRKRALLQGGISALALAGTAGIPGVAKADPFIIGSLVGAIAASVLGGAYALSAKKQEGLNTLELERKRLVMQRVDYFFNGLPLNEQLAMVQDGSYYRALLSENLDGFGSLLAVKDGQLMLARGQYGGPVHSDMAVAMSTVMKESGIAPAPVNYLSAAENDRLVQAAGEYLGAKMGMSKDRYLAERPPREITTMSLASKPRRGGEDFAFFTSLNVKDARQRRGRREAPVEVNPVPMRYLA